MNIHVLIELTWLIMINEHTCTYRTDMAYHDNEHTCTYRTDMAYHDNEHTCTYRTDMAYHDK